MEFFDCPISTKFYEFKPKNMSISVGNSANCDIKLDFLKTHLRFTIEYNGMDGWDIKADNSIKENSGTWLQITKKTPISSNLSYKLGSGYLKATLHESLAL